MPELPEVETIVRRLSEVLPAKVIRTVNVLRKKSFLGDTESLVGVRIESVSRRAKIICVHLSNQQYLLIHLKMTGQLLYVEGATRLGGGHPTDDFIATLPSIHTRVILTFSDETSLYFNDMRVFGWVHLETEAGKAQVFKNIAPDITDASITDQYLHDQFSRRSQAIKQVVMDNAIVAGVGNIYACDALHLAKIDPTRKAKSLSLEEVQKLLQAMRTVIELGIELGGATIQHYTNVEGLIGHYQDVRRVYAREGKPCPVCGAAIERIKQGGRSTFFCPACQA